MITTGFDMKNNNRFKLFLMMLLLNIVPAAYAQQFDQAYLKWKAEQQTQDAKLKQQNSENYYLSKPNVNQHASTHTSATTSAQNFSGVTTTKISLNSATLAQLQQLKGVGAKKAQAIIDFRNQNGAFKTIQDLEKVKGIGPKLLAQNKAILAL